MSTSKPSQQTHRFENASDCLKRNSSDILKKWAQTIELELADTQLASYVSNQANIHFFEKLTQKLMNRELQVAESDLSVPKRWKESTSPKTPALNQMISAYHILRRVILNVLSEQAPVTLENRKTISAFIHDEIADLIMSSPRPLPSALSLEFTSIIEDLKKAQETKNPFSLALAHDLRVPLTAARMSSQLIPRLLDQPETVLKLASKITHDLDRINQMITDLLNANKIPATPQISPICDKIDLNPLIHSVLDSLSRAYGNRFAYINPGTLVSGFWNEQLLIRAIENLLDNAVKYGRPDSLISISVQKISDCIEIRIHNEGIPIAKEQIKLLFQMYYRSDVVEKCEKAGWGLGLPFVEYVAKAHKGEIYAESSLKNGTTFILKLPQDKRLLS